MKKIFAFLMALVMVLVMAGCGSSDREPEPSATPEPTAREQLKETEEQLFTALIKMTTADFYEPSKIRILEIGDYYNGTNWADDVLSDIMYGPDTVVVRLQGENRVGGTLNHYYKVVIVAAKNESDSAQNSLSFAKYRGDMEGVLRYEGEVGDYAELGDGYSLGRIESTQNYFNIGRVNKALAEYWADLGF